MKGLAVLFAILVLAVYADPLFVGRTFGGRDLPAYNLPMEKAVHDAYKRGRLPVWAADVSGGRPLLPNPNAGALYPARGLLSLIPFEAAVKIYPVLHWILAGVGTALLLRVSGASGGGQWIGAVTYAFSGVAVSEVFFPHIQPGMAFLPWIVWAVRRPSSGATRLLLLSILLGLEMLAGDAFTLVMGLAAGYLWIAAEEPGDRRGHLAMALAGGAVLGLLAAAPQVLATVLWIPETIRGVTGVSFGESFFFSLSPWRALEFLIPFAFGPTADLDQTVVWGRVLFHDKSAGLFSTIYCGSLPLLALFSRRRLREPGCRFARILFIGGLSVCVLPSLAPRSLETIRSPLALRNPEKFAVLCIFALAILAGWAYEVERRHATRPLVRILIGAALSTVAVFSFLWPWKAAAVAIRLIGAPLSVLPAAASSLAVSLAEGGLFWIVTVVALDILSFQSRAAQTVSLAILTLVPIAANRRIARSFSEAEVFSRTAFERWIERSDPAGRYRTLGESMYRPASPLQDLCQRTDPTYTDYARRSWTQHTQALWNRGTVLNYDFDNGDLSRVESLRRVVRRFVESGDPAPIFAGFALRFGIRFRDQPPLPGYGRVGGDLLQDWDENRESLPNIRLLRDWREETSALAALEHFSMDPGKPVLETGSRELGAARPGRIAVLEDTPERIRIEAQSLDPGWLFVLRPFWTYRTVQVDGRLVEPVPAQLAFSAVPIPAGRHTVEWKEDVPGMSVSRWGLVLFALAAIGLVIIERRRGRLP